ncbi:MAG: 2-dehydropantoate 2-reductase [Hyphomicrobiales bacterium]|nr:2-dehydropantoate 2-reductase [Hyphomicrobiales bacterium]
MRICIIGAGAIGGLLAAKLSRGGEDVSVIARGLHLAAIAERGLILHEDGREIVAPVKASNRLADVGEQDLIVLGMKAHQVGAIVRDLPAIMRPETAVLTAQNGIPWWYFFRHGGPYEGVRLESVDPGGVIADNLPIDRVIASVVYPAAEIERPGAIRHVEGARISLAELDGSKSERIATVAEAFAKAGFKAPVVTDVRSEIWMKLLGNLSFNPISALTHATLEDICRFPPTRALSAEMMREAQAVGEAFSVRFRISLEKRIAGAEAVGAHRTSMLQDVEAGRALESEALIGSVVELGRMAKVSTPHLDAVYATVKLLGETLTAAKGKLVVTPA